MSFQTRTILFLCLLLCLVMPTLAQRQTNTDGLIDVMKETPGLGRFAEMVEALDLADRFNNTDVFYTVFALEDATADALLSDLGYDNLDDLTENDELTLAVIVTYHFLPGAYDEATFAAIQEVTDAPLQLASALTGTTLTYDDGTVDEIARITQADLPGSNGFIHIVDNYLVPTKDAFERSVDVVNSDATLTEDQADQLSLAQNLRGADDFTMMAEALEAIDLMNNLDEQGPYTLFVMTDASFNTVLEQLNVTWEELLADEERLTNILLYHVLSGQYSSAALQQYDETFIGTMLPRTVVGIVIDGDTVRVNNVPLTVTDVVASNGIIHVIDGLLLPPGDE